MMATTLWPGWLIVVVALTGLGAEAHTAAAPEMDGPATSADVPVGASPHDARSTASGGPKSEKSSQVTRSSPPPTASTGPTVSTSPTVPTGSTGSTSSTTPAQDPEAILERTSRAYEEMHSIRAGFEQRLENRLLGRTTESAGTLYQREPDKFLMDFSHPEGDLIVSDGRYFWMYYPSVDEKQVLRTARRNQGLDLQAQFIGDVGERFDVTYHGTEEVRGRTAHVMTLDPRQPLGYRRLKVWIDEEDHLVRRFELTEENGNIRHMELIGVTLNPELPDHLFEFTPPEGALVVDRG